MFGGNCDDEGADDAVECCFDVDWWMLVADVLAAAGVMWGPLDAVADVRVGGAVVEDAAVADVGVAVADVAVAVLGGDGFLPSAICSDVAGPRHLGCAVAVVGRC